MLYPERSLGWFQSVFLTISLFFFDFFRVYLMGGREVGLRYTPSFLFYSILAMILDLLLIYCLFILVLDRLLSKILHLIFLFVFETAVLLLSAGILKCYLSYNRIRTSFCG